MIRASVAGASGYTGGELVRWLVHHPQVALVSLTADQHRGRSLPEVFPHLEGFVRKPLREPDWRRLGQESDVVFLALPHGLALEAAPEILAAGARVVDLGPDFRLRDPAQYARWYGREHTAAHLLEEAVYGLPEFHRSRIREAHLVAVPGCYPTAALLGLVPLLRAGYGSGPAVVDAKSGVSGAGRSVSLGTHFSEVNENVRPYNVAHHRHVPELEQALAEAGCPAAVCFVPHLIPMTRGILATCYVRLARPLESQTALDLYREAYAGEPFVRVLAADLPQTKATYGSNFCDVTVRVDVERRMAIAIAALDNLGKGAAGQAIQCMNLMFGLPETTGLLTPPLFP
ncbi:MAG: N-acetyl-gamma-glutamyl-phosphate reductase [Armatimonadota bacterium]|nr:N-acetyl-gamma-glutamyl-phosphate reductase [Armatimonadota bacterium]MDR7439766.1 N-acetyl-gamma-glutamyl-phosphate reductase [Armatimonadota bacterium]MDR7562273.1 N-acetyl-gamma-glutamyl-phosphate reductase [Armatimonadota bacterium]MDR7568714.1 N-acetyl-gamma-glutamyl-phosphate reductase [Armatimonadota bacterium]MDR7602663.1 N-acetyl-gamma-glutamyl-phosphate reductase [Armatimonadota bacterium]